ncbi:response regulator transcription factor [Glaciimonas sp. Gout2]|uniref:response regulator transcription factor n=1 Tax=unclassified Glaciimonas TaxID=2644401 RepID=UPI002B2382E8|nr:MULTISPECIES: response regulator transcription factor [unclassified Glaciimonas]MEB0013716.1 response regulator transcription factor [Glaciimonas sp. Cout2]MEB0083321.1 response regulator transcription factor [Glaciimonas sp. Gout2]
MPINIIIVEDSTLVRKGLVSIISNFSAPNASPQTSTEQTSYNVVADVASPKELLEALKTHNPDLLLLDYSLQTDSTDPHPLHALDGHNLIKHIRKNYSTNILVVSHHHSPIIIRAALEAGANGYISKSANEEVLWQAIQAVIKGDTFVEHHLLKAMLYRNPETAVISPKEIEVLRLMGKGSRLTDIAQCMSLSIKTVSAHKLRAMEKLSIRNDSELYRVIAGMAL